MAEPNWTTLALELDDELLLLLLLLEELLLALLLLLLDKADDWTGPGAAPSWLAMKSDGRGSSL